jgi:hypothetical protein
MTPSSLKEKLLNVSFISDYYFPFYVQAYAMLDSVKIDIDIRCLVNRVIKKVSEWVEDCKKLGRRKAYSIFVQIMENFSYSWWKEVMTLFKDDLKRIINNAPAVKKEIVVYRGVKDDYFLKGAKDNYYTNTSFVSCSLDPSYALTFLRADNQCCLKRITILPGTKVLFISGLSAFYEELEIVINIDSTLFIQNKFTTSIYKTPNNKDICFDKNVEKRLIDIAEIVVV